MLTVHFKFLAYLKVHFPLPRGKRSFTVFKAKIKYTINWFDFNFFKKKIKKSLKKKLII